MTSNGKVARWAQRVGLFGPIIRSPFAGGEIVDVITTGIRVEGQSMLADCGTQVLMAEACSDDGALRSPVDLPQTKPP